MKRAEHTMPEERPVQNGDERRPRTTAAGGARRLRTLRAGAAAACGAVGVILILLGALLAYGTRTVFDSTVFADRTARSLADPRVASFIASRVTDALIQQDRDLTPYRPLILATTQSAVSSAPFRAIIRRGVQLSHQLLLTEGGQHILLTVSDVGVILRSTLATLPELAQKIPEDAAATIVSLNTGPIVEFAGEMLRLGRDVRSYALLAVALGAALLYAGILLSMNRRTALLRAGIALTAIAVVMILSVQFSGVAIAAVADDGALGNALAGLWDSFAVGLRPIALALGGIGLLLAAAATALFEKVDIENFMRALRSALRLTAGGRLIRLLRAGALIVAGGITVAHPWAVAELLLVLAGGVVLFVGLRELCRLALFSAAEPAARGAAVGTAADRRGYHAVRLALAGAVIMALLVVGATVFTRTPSLSSSVRTVDACNGHPELCDRPLDQVVFPATHNSMAAAEIPTWMFANQEYGISAQLRDGIRGFMIDVYSGMPVGDAVKTDLGGGEIVRETYDQVLGREGVDAAIRIRDRLTGGTQTDRALYLCHGLCELGATPLVPALAEMHDFLVMNPNEVLIIIIEDGAPPEDVEAAFQESGLIDFVYRREPGPPWPTLREMILADERVLVLAEHDSSGVPWYHQAFEVFQETPYEFTQPDDFSCAPHRGGTAGSLFLINHWVSTPPSPLPSNAEKVNAYAMLLGRARECQRERVRLPNIIAVDFYGTGDLFRVVRTLNEIPEN